MCVSVTLAPVPEDKELASEKDKNLPTSLLIMVLRQIQFLILYEQIFLLNLFVVVCFLQSINHVPN